MNVYHFGDFTFDLESKQLLHKGVQRHLTPKAQQLLHSLLHARPRAVAAEAEDITSAIDEVRRALDDDPQTPRFIRSVRTRGYAFIAGATEAPQRARIVTTFFCEGRSYPLIEGQFVIGRGANADVQLAHETVSRRHARLIVGPHEVHLEDLGSSNGTFVDGRRINGASPLTRDSVIRIARVVASVA